MVNTPCRGIAQNRLGQNVDWCGSFATSSTDDRELDIRRPRFPVSSICRLGPIRDRRQLRRNASLVNLDMDTSSCESVNFLNGVIRPTSHSRLDLKCIDMKWSDGADPFEASSLAFML